MPRASPFTRTTRFPDEYIGVDMDHAYISSSVRTIVSALNARQIEKNREQPDTVDGRVMSNLEDAKVAYFHAAEELLSANAGTPVETMSIYGIYTQTSSEDTFELKWA